MSDLIDRIEAAQREAGERVVLDDLKAKGLLEACTGKHGSQVECEIVATLLAALKRAARELEMYVDLQQKLDYIEYAAQSQIELDAVNAAITVAERGSKP